MAIELALLLAASTAYNAGKVVGYLFIPLLLIAVIVWATRKYRR